jgi:hypothetical protein
MSVKKEKNKKILPFEDTDEDALEVLVELTRNMPFWKRAERIVQLNNTRRSLILADLRHRYPDADEAELRKRLAARLLPREDVIRVYGWDPEKEGY